MKIKFLFMLCFLCTFGMVISQTAHAAIYKYLDKDGLVCFASDLQSVPERYRASAQIVSGAADQDTSSSTQNKLREHPFAGNREHAPGMSPDTSSAQQNEKSFPGSRVLPSAMIVVSAAFAFVILGILDNNHKKNVKIARVVILWSVTVYLLYVHAGDAVRMVRSIGGAVGTIEHQSAEKGQSAAKMVKSLNALTEQADQALSTGTPEAEREKKE